MFQLSHILWMSGVNSPLDVISQNLEIWKTSKVVLSLFHPVVDLLGRLGSQSRCFTQIQLSFSWSTATLTLTELLDLKASEISFK